MSLRVAILRKLYAKRVWGAKHLTLQTILHMGWRGHERGDVKRTVELMIAEGLLVWYNRNKEAVQINDERIYEIRTIIQDSLD